MAIDGIFSLCQNPENSVYETSLEEYVKQNA